MGPLKNRDRHISTRHVSAAAPLKQDPNSNFYFSLSFLPAWISASHLSTRSLLLSIQFLCQFAHPGRLLSQTLSKTTR